MSDYDERSAAGAMCASSDDARARLAGIPSVTILERPLLAAYTRFGIGGPADLLVEASTSQAFAQAIDVMRACGLPFTVIGGGTNLVVSDRGFAGVVIRYTAAGIRADGERVLVEAGAVLQDLVDFAVDQGLRGLETMTGIPGWVGAAIYGNAGAYGHSIAERVSEVRFHDGRSVRTVDHAACEFRYRESTFKRHKDWIILDAELSMTAADRAELRTISSDILRVRNQKYPPTMKCAGSIFKNLILAELPETARSQVPEKVVREGKVPSAYFLEQVGAKGERIGDIQVAEYHANLIYNDGVGTAADLRRMIAELKRRVRERFGLELEEEVQYVGFAEQP